MPAGRPSAYRRTDAEQARKLALLGATDIEIADFFGVDGRTIYRWKRRHPEFCQAITRGKMMADAEVAERLYQRAIGYSHGAVKIFMPAGAEAPIYAPYTQHYPPDTQAASLWLRNRQPEKWRDRRDIGVDGSLEHRPRQMTPEQREQDAQELYERVQRRLAELQTEMNEGDH